MGASYELDLEREDRFDKVRFPFGSKLFPTIDGANWLNYKGWFNLEMLYKRAYEWLSEYDYVDIDGDGDKFEHYFFENRSGDGIKTEMLFWWRTQKIPDGNPMFRYRIFIDFQVLYLASDTYVVDGQKFKQDYGEVSLFIKPFLDVELNNKTNKSLLGGGKITPWTKDGITGGLTNWFKNKVYRNQIEERRTELYNQVNELYAIIKQFLNMQNYVSVRRDMHPEKGLPQYKL